MATSHCLVCGRSFAYYDGNPSPHFCSLACALDAGPVRNTLDYLTHKRLRAAKTARALVDVESAVPRPSTGKKGNE